MLFASLENQDVFQWQQGPKRPKEHGTVSALTVKGFLWKMEGKYIHLGYETVWHYRGETWPMKIRVSDKIRHNQNKHNQMWIYLEWKKDEKYRKLLELKLVSQQLRWIDGDALEMMNVKLILSNF